MNIYELEGIFESIILRQKVLLDIEINEETYDTKDYVSPMVLLIEKMQIEAIQKADKMIRGYIGELKSDLDIKV